MPRLLVHVEGQTEETFVNEVLRPHLLRAGYERVDARLLGNARLRHHRGGIRGWGGARNDIVQHLKQDHGAIATTMVDFYGLPRTGGRSWPGRADAALLGAPEKALRVEEAIAEDIAINMGEGFDPSRFVPYVVLHEFEGLLFSDCEAFARGIYRPDLRAAFQDIRDDFVTPEDINDSPLTAPSKRIQTCMHGYEKVVHGNLAALAIGLDEIRKACPHFRGWLERLETVV